MYINKYFICAYFDSINGKIAKVLRYSLLLCELYKEIPLIFNFAELELHVGSYEFLYIVTKIYIIEFFFLQSKMRRTYLIVVFSKICRKVAIMPINFPSRGVFIRGRR